MHVFLAYLLATVLIVFGLRALGIATDDHALVMWLRIVVYFGLGVGLLYVVWRYVRRW